MAFAVKDWKDADPTTPWTAAAAEDLEQRLANYTDERVGEFMSFSVLAYGALPGVPGDDAAAFQAAYDAAKAAVGTKGGGALVYAPGGHGSYTLNAGVTVDNTVPVRFAGDGVRKTTIARTSGTTTMFTVAGTLAAQARAIDFVDMELDGGSLGGVILDISRVSALLLQNLEIRRSAVTGLWLRKIWNATMLNVHTYSCGNGTTNPAVLFDAMAEAQGSCITVLGVNCLWEGNGGTDVRFTGSVANSSAASNITFIGSKFEAGVGAHPYIDHEYAQGIHFIGGQISRGSGRTGLLVQQTGTTTGTRANIFSAFLLDADSGTAAAHYVDHGVGSMIFDGVTLVGAPTTAFFRVRSAVGAGRFRLSAQVANNANLVLDERSPRELHVRLSAVLLHNWPSLASGAADSTTVTVTGAAVGDHVPTPWLDTALPAGVILHGAVTAANTVTVTRLNMSGAAHDPPNAALRVDVWK